MLGPCGCMNSPEWSEMPVHESRFRTWSEILEGWDDRFALFVPGEESDFNYLFFRVASGEPHFWFKEIEVQVI